MIGRNDRDIASRQMMPKVFNLAAGPQRRIDLGLPAKAPDIVIFVERQIMNAGLDRRTMALGAISGCQFISATDRTVDNVHRAPGARA